MGTRSPSTSAPRSSVNRLCAAPNQTDVDVDTEERKLALYSIRAGNCKMNKLTSSARDRSFRANRSFNARQRSYFDSGRSKYSIGALDRSKMTGQTDF